MRAGVSNETPGKVTGRDGKQYTAKRRQRVKQAPDLIEQASAFNTEIINFIADYCPRVAQWHKAHPELPKQDRGHIIWQLYQCAEMVQRLAQAIDGRSPEDAWSEEHV
jgi:hypothetical protein